MPNPFRDGGPRFNLSQSHGMLLVAIATVDVGIDVEFIDSQVDLSDIAPIVFSPAEEKSISRLATDERQRSYFQCWTRKEAFVKATGEGLSDDMKHIAVAASFGNPFLRIHGVPGADRWTVADLYVGVDFAAAVAVAIRNCSFHLWDWPGTFADSPDSLNATRFGN